MFKPTWRQLMAIGLTAVAVRVLLCLLVLWRGDLTPIGFAELRDGGQYLAMGQAWMGDFTALEALAEDRTILAKRLFPLCPALIGLLHRAGVPLVWSSLLPNWIMVGFVAAGYAALFEDRRVGWAMALLTPSYLLNSTLISTETTSLLLVLLAIVLGMRRHHIWAGIIFGLAGLARPVAVFAALGYFIYAMAHNRWRGALVVTLCAMAIFSIGAALVYLRFHVEWLGFCIYAGHEQAYAGQLLTWPFNSLMHTPLDYPVARWKIVYVWLHVAAALFTCGVMLRQVMKERPSAQRAFTWMMAAWLCANTLFVLCLGDRWGFHEFHRFIVPALPPAFWAVRFLLPHGRGWWLWLPIAAVSIALAFQGLLPGVA